MTQAGNLSSIANTATANSLHLLQTLGPTPIDPAILSAHVRTLGSDAFEGRGVATIAETKTLEYLTEQFELLGAEPGGEAGHWTQDVPLHRFEIAGDMNIGFDIGGKLRQLTRGTQVVANTLRPEISHLNLKDIPIVFAGYGVVAPEVDWDDFNGVDVRGKLLVVLINDPDIERPEPGRFGGKAMTYYGRWMYKFEEAARQGAIGALIVHETVPATYGWQTVSNTMVLPQLDIERPDSAAEHPLLEGWIHRDIAVELFANAGLDFDVLKKAAQSPDFMPVELSDIRFHANYRVEHHKILSRNFLAKITGSRFPNETIIYSAHWDHLGLGRSASGEAQIYNGALDNGSGLAGLLELARAHLEGTPPERTIVFFAPTAEEKGLLGSTFYVKNPIYPLELTVANLNMDTLRGTGPARDLSITGREKLSLKDNFEKAAERHQRAITPDRHPERGGFYRTDNFPFAKLGVPACSIISGYDLIEGGVEAAEQWNGHFISNCYHQPKDIWTPELDFCGQALDVGLLYEVGKELANSRQWPTWSVNSEFRAIRDLSDGLRS